jgi:hypothetical protein
MSKFVKIMVALLAIAVFAAPAIAEDRLGLAGQMRVLFNYTDAGGDDTNSFLSQRLRVGGKFSIADGVSVTFRTDWTESNWGSGNTFGSGRMANDANGNLQWDRAHIDLDFDGFALRAGQQLVWLGNETANSQSNGFKLVTKGNVPVTLFWMLQDDNNVSEVEAGFTFDPDTGLAVANTVADAQNNSDAYFFGGNVAHKTDMYSANVFFAGQDDGSDEEVYVVGVDAAFNFDAVKVSGEIDYFTGDASATVDAVGLQGFIDVAFAASEMMTFGGQVYYAQAADAGEEQYEVLGNDFDYWDPMFAIGVGLDNIKEAGPRPYQMLGDDAGIIALRGYAKVKVNDATTLGASIAYAEPEDDDMTAADSGMYLAAGVAYKLMANTSVRAQVTYEDVDKVATEEVLKLHTGLFVNF